MEAHVKIKIKKLNRTFQKLFYMKKCLKIILQNKINKQIVQTQFHHIEKIIIIQILVINHLLINSKIQFIRVQMIKVKTSKNYLKYCVNQVWVWIKLENQL